MKANDIFSLWVCLGLVKSVSSERVSEIADNEASDPIEFAKIRWDFQIVWQMMISVRRGGCFYF